VFCCLNMSNNCTRNRSLLSTKFCFNLTKDVHYGLQNISTDRITGKFKSNYGLRFWLMHCTTIWKDACLIPHGVFEIFLSFNDSGFAIALGFFQTLKKGSTRNMYWGVKILGVYV
jgi:hypothetical protein